MSKINKDEALAGVGEDVAAGRLTVKEGHALAAKIEGAESTTAERKAAGQPLVDLKVENWDNLTLAWLKTQDGLPTLKLIKAAPDLLAACQILVSWAKGNNLIGTNDEPPGIDEAIAAIAKAKAL